MGGGCQEHVDDHVVRVLHSKHVQRVDSECDMAATLAWDIPAIPDRRRVVSWIVPARLSRVGRRVSSSLRAMMSTIIANYQPSSSQLASRHANPWPSVIPPTYLLNLDNIHRYTQTKHKHLPAHLLFPSHQSSLPKQSRYTSVRITTAYFLSPPIQCRQAICRTHCRPKNGTSLFVASKHKRSRPHHGPSAPRRHRCLTLARWTTLARRPRPTPSCPPRSRSAASRQTLPMLSAPARSCAATTSRARFRAPSAPDAVAILVSIRGILHCRRRGLLRFPWVRPQRLDIVSFVTCATALNGTDAGVASTVPSTYAAPIESAGKDALYNALKPSSTPSAPVSTTDAIPAAQPDSSSTLTLPGPAKTPYYSPATPVPGSAPYYNPSQSTVSAAAAPYYSPERESSTSPDGGVAVFELPSSPVDSKYNVPTGFILGAEHKNAPNSDTTEAKEGEAIDAMSSAVPPVSAKQRQSSIISTTSQGDGPVEDISSFDASFSRALPGYRGAPTVGMPGWHEVPEQQATSKTWEEDLELRAKVGAELQRKANEAARRAEEDQLSKEFWEKERIEREKAAAEETAPPMRPPKQMAVGTGAPTPATLAVDDPWSDHRDLDPSGTQTEPPTEGLAPLPPRRSPAITTALRIYWRIRPTNRIGADDYTLVFAWVSRQHHRDGHNLTGFANKPHCRR